jgi:hypothetical protein
MAGISSDESQLKELTKVILDKLSEGYWDKLHAIIKERPYLKDSFPGFLLNPEKLIIYIGKNHWGIEYVGALNRLHSDNRDEILPIEIKNYSDSEWLMDEILGINFDGSSFRFTLQDGYIENLFLPTNAADDILSENGWNYAAESMFLGYNIKGINLLEKKHYRFVNCFFYGTDSHGLLTRHIKWMDIFPFEIQKHSRNYKKLMLSFWRDFNNQASRDAEIEYPMPIGFQQEKLVQLNRFVEMYSSERSKETDITRFLSEEENQFILKMAFFAKEIHQELECEWLDQNKKAIRPDFFITNPNGYSDIVEFKLPTIKNSIIVGQENRETFSAEINSYISQTRVYTQYFEDSKNRQYVLENHSVKVLYPKRWLVVGRRWMFGSDEWRAIENEFRDFAIRTYDDLVDGVISQLYS